MNDELPNFVFTELKLAGHFLTLCSPVQAEGTLEGKRFYFRARHEAWEFFLSASPDIDPLDVPASDLSFYREGSFGHRRSDASYMSADTAISIIRACAEDYLRCHDF